MIVDATNVTKFQVDPIFYWVVRANVVVFLATVTVRSTSTLESGSTLATSTMTSTIVIISSPVVVIMIGCFSVIDCIYIYILCI